MQYAVSPRNLNGPLCCKHFTLLVKTPPWQDVGGLSCYIVQVEMKLEQTDHENWLQPMSSQSMSPQWEKGNLLMPFADSTSVTAFYSCSAHTCIPQTFSSLGEMLMAQVCQAPCCWRALYHHANSTEQDGAAVWATLVRKASINKQLKESLLQWAESNRTATSILCMYQKYEYESFCHLLFLWWMSAA